LTTRREREQQVVVEGRVVADFGREFLVEFADRRQIVCTRKGRRQDATCGDFVTVRITGSAQGSIERVGTRRNLLYRSDQWREKTLAANVDQAVILLAPRPAFNEAFLNLSLVACEAAGIPVIIALNKSDLPSTPRHANRSKTTRASAIRSSASRPRRMSRPSCPTWRTSSRYWSDRAGSESRAR
jgi:ribosome biogenesis GTPase